MFTTLTTEERAAVASRFHARLAEDIARGKRLVERGDFQPDGMVENIQLLSYWKSQRGAVDARGQCSGGCRRAKIVGHLHQHYLVCKHTYEPCRVFSLRLVVELFSRIGDMVVNDE